MKQRSIAYWTATVFVSCVIGISGILAITHAGLFRRRPDGVGTSGDLRGVGNFLYLSPSEQALRGSTAETSLLGPKNRNCKWLLE